MFEKFSELINNNIKFINIILILIILYFIRDFLYEAAWLAAILIPYFFISYKWDLGLLERALLSLPLAALSMNILYLLAVWGIPLPIYLVYVIVFGLPLVVAALFYREKITSDIAAVIKNNHLQSLTLLFLLIIVIATLFAYQGFLNISALPLTNATDYLSKMHFVSSSLRYHDSIFNWFDKQQLGYPLFTFDAYLSFIFGGVYLLFYGGSLIKAFNFLFLCFMLFMFLGSFLLSRFLLKNNFYAFLSSMIFIINPAITLPSLISGGFKLFLAFSTMPVTLYFIIKAYERINTNIKNLVLIPLLLLFTTLSHSSIGIPLLFILFTVGVLYQVKDGFQHIDLIWLLKVFVKPFILFFIVFMFYIIPMFVYFGYTSKITFELKNINILADIINPLFNEPSLDGNYSNVGLIYGILLSLAFITFIKDYFNVKANTLHLFLLAFMLSWILIFVASNYVDLVSKALVESEKLIPFFAFFYSILISFLFLRWFEIFKNIIFISFLLIIVIIFIWYYLYTTHQKALHYISSEVLHLNLQHSSKLYDYFNSLNGRFITYGTYGTTLHPVFSIIYNVPTNGVGFWQGQHTDIYITRLTNIHNWSVPDKTNTEELFKLFKMTYTNNIFIAFCQGDTFGESGKEVIMRFSACKKCEFSDLKKSSSCEVMAILDSNFIDGSNIIPTEANYDSLTLEKVEHKRKNPEEILIKNPKSKYLFVKEEYFPRWHAFQEGAGEVPVTMSDLGLMVVENRNGNNILLKYEIFLWEKILFLISIGSMVVLIFSPKYK